MDANAELQKLIIHRELGDGKESRCTVSAASQVRHSRESTPLRTVIDLDYLGLNGIEPEFIKEAKAKAMEDEAGFWHKIVDGARLRDHHVAS